MAFPIVVVGGAIVGLAIFGPTSHGLTVTLPSSTDGSILIVEGSGLGRRLGRDAAARGASILMLDTPELGIHQRSFNGDENQFVQRTVDKRSLDAIRIESFSRDRAASPRRYSITDLGTLGGTESFAYAVNDSGQVVGSSGTTGDASSHAFLYSHGTMTDLYPLNSQNVQTVGPTGINNAGQIASGVVVEGVYVPAILDSQTGVLTLLGSFGGIFAGVFNGVTTSINNRGNAVGYSYIDNVNRHAFLFAKGTMTDIGSFGGYSAALAINDEGLIVGFGSSQNNGVANAFVYADRAMTDIEPATESYANGLNNRGQVVGEFLTADQTAFHAFLYQNGNFTDLGSSNSPETVAYAINDQAQIVGITLIPYKSVCSGVSCTQYRQHAFLYENGTMADLNNLIPQPSTWELVWAFGINNRGQIAGYGLVNGNFHAFLLTAS